MAIDLRGHKALVTGATQGVGQAMAEALAQAGADVLIHGLNADEMARDAVAACRNAGVTAELVTGDLSGPTETCVNQLFHQAVAIMPDIDILVNNAGTFIDTPFLEMDLQRFEHTMRLNVAAGYFLTQAFARRWIEQRIAGRVLFTGSINGMLAEPDHTAYDTSKGAVATMVKTLCVSLAPHNIRVNGLAPGLVRTPLTKVLDEDASLDRWMKLHTPNGQVPGPEVCGEAAAFLVSDAARHIHGQMLLVDGGMSVWQQPDPPSGF
ncbi:MAG: SDR family oxidoreductase [Planctomycetaceae bacterium]|nr:SDR family oxidoreductase [Planctomycetales bacterium]MCB9923426.1 SDR family oxidoreductase [Planctomycetaceae bacterium]